MKKFLKAIDIYGGDINLTINKNEKIKTIMGGCLTLFTLLSLHILGWFVGNDIFYKVRPFSYVDNKITADYPKSYINKTNFPLAFGLSDYDSVPLVVENLIQYELVKKDFLISNKTGFFELVNSTIIDYRACVPSDFPMIKKEAFYAASLSGYFCPVSNNLFVEGYWSEKIVSFLSLSVKKCDYDINPNFCGTKAEIDKFIIERFMNINIITIENILSVANYENPITPTLLILYKFLHTKNSKITNFMIQKNNLLTDYGFFLETYEQNDFLKISELQTEVLDLDENTKEMMQMNIYSSNKSDTYFRKYIKITDILASLGGLIKVTLIFISFLNIPFKQFEKFSLIYQKIFSDEDDFNLNKNENTYYDDSFLMLNKKNFNSNFSKKKGETKILNINNDIINEENKEYAIKNDSNALNEIKKIKTFDEKFKTFNLKNSNGNIKKNQVFNNLSKVNHIEVNNRHNEKINNLSNKIATKNSLDFKSHFPKFSKNHIEQRKKFKKNKKDNFIKQYFFNKVSKQEIKENDYFSFFYYVDNTNSCNFFIGLVKYICGCKKSNNARKYEKINLLNEKIKTLLDINNIIQILIEYDITKNIIRS